MFVAGNYPKYGTLGHQIKIVATCTHLPFFCDKALSFLIHDISLTIMPNRPFHNARDKLWLKPFQASDNKNYILMNNIVGRQSLSHALQSAFMIWWQYEKFAKIFACLTYKILLSFTFISDGHRSFIPNITKFTKYCHTQCISKLHRSFEIHWVRQYLVTSMGLLGMVNTTVYKTVPISSGLGHGKLS